MCFCCDFWCVFVGGEQLALGMLGERFGSEAAEIGVCAAQHLTRLRLVALVLQPFVVYELVVCELDCCVVVCELFD